MGLIRREELILTVADILDLPRTKKRGEAHRIVNAVFQALTKILKMGKRVRIQGLGTFTVRVRKAHIKCIPIHYQKNNAYVPMRIPIPERRYVVFIPSRELRRSLNAQ